MTPAILPPKNDISSLVYTACRIWNTRSKKEALIWLTSNVRRHQRSAKLHQQVIRRESQLLCLSRMPGFDLQKELTRFARDIADL